MEADQIKQRFERAKAKKQEVESEISQAYRYTNPSQDPQKSAGSLPDRLSLYDTTAGDASNTLTNAIISYLLPKDQAWVSLSLSEAFKRSGQVTGEAELLVETETARYYEAINGSNFYLAASEAISDLIIAGTGCVGLEATAKGLRYTAIPISQLFYLDNGDGDVDVVFRSHSLAARLICSRYKNKVPTWIEQIEKERPDEMIDIVESMTPIKNGKYEFAVYCTKDWHCLAKQSVDFKNFIVFRWDKTSGCVWGDSPVRKALPAIMTANRIVMDNLDYSDFAARGAWVSNDETLKDQKLIGGTILFSDADLKAVPLPGNYSISVQMLTDARAQVREALMADVLPPATETNRMTQDEVQIRHSQFFRRIGTAALRIEEEFVEPVVENTIRALQNINRMSRFEIGNMIVITTNSLVKRVMAMRELEQVMTLLGVASQLGPSGTAHIDLPKTGRYLLERGGFPASLLKPLEQVEQELAAANAVQAAGGMAAAEGGQSNQETTQATGQAVAQLMSRAA